MPTIKTLMRPLASLAFVALALTAEASPFAVLKYAVSEPLALKASSPEYSFDATSVVEARIVADGKPVAWTLVLDNGLTLDYVPQMAYTAFGDHGLARLSLTRDGVAVATADFDEPFSFDKKAGVTLGLNIDGSSLTAYGGSSSLIPLLQHAFHEAIPLPTKASVACRGGATLLYVGYKPGDVRDMTIYPLPHDAIDSEGPCGYWHYFDRENDPRRALPGGRYTLAVVPDPEDSEAYLILYVDGAEVDAATWQPGMLKGRLRSTPFVGQYDLEWYPAKGMTLLDRDCHATYDSRQRLLTLAFPLLKATLRFSFGA